MNKVNNNTSKLNNMMSSNIIQLTRKIIELNTKPNENDSLLESLYFHMIQK